MGSVLNGLPYKLFITTFHPVLTLLYLPDPLSRDISITLSVWENELYELFHVTYVLLRYIPQIYCIRFVRGPLLVSLSR